ncbi:5-amino-6-(5-phosphoribosylamino)uracil reductase [Amycolatopsis bartoniae]|uniref:Riboflavin biosynthesis protein RibD n=1 Tax=Amycolatopsis bartoniae TaxID=941986 RepID=A0A8H9J068_9PSEU|nr:dihydrofolate reductase family protein [Amycolatopsis bartoniae]MBB2934046.1 5-amino-6-(5-phosphoribosylamino)uracil reductase [Amycolatopsis bartoniae]TVT07339.1 5-amino-6-(5-phosphoribosylamino)uracil reductase [Amycolatopsis bartoniae]GHF84725.1 5-amino-6-(5-phosphoribosylamino)uracil reductase [Amycolatopsis bartoniae]
MSKRPYVLASAAMSLDGYLDDTSQERLLLSSPEDFDRVDQVRAGADAILVGAGTIRADNPRLLSRSGPDPVKVTLTTSGKLDPGAKFFTTGDVAKLVYAASPAVPALRAQLGDVATVVDASEPLDVHRLLADLADRGIGRLMVEGGSAVHTLFLTEDVVDELHLVVAPFFVGQREAPRFVGAGRFPQGRMLLVETRQLGDVVLLRYLTGQAARDHRRLREAAELAEQCPPSATFRVGAVITDASDRVLATGFSGETDPHDHAEEAALAKLGPEAPLAEATIYSSLEPCSARASRPVTCTQHILDAGIPRIVFAWREPAVFVDAQGAELLRAAGREVIEIPELAPLVQQANTHLPGVG